MLHVEKYAWKNADQNDNDLIKICHNSRVDFVFMLQYFKMRAHLSFSMCLYATTLLFILTIKCSRQSYSRSVP